MSLIATALVTVACSAPDTPDVTLSPMTGTPDVSDQQDTPTGLTIDVTIAGGHVTPTNVTLRAAVKEAIVIRVDSDMADQLHIHSVPEYTFEVAPRYGQSFQFSVDVPGRVAIELHHLNRTVATIQVR